MTDDQLTTAVQGAETGTGTLTEPENSVPDSGHTPSSETAVTEQPIPSSAQVATDQPDQTPSGPAAMTTVSDDAKLFDQAMADLESDDPNRDNGRQIKKGDRIEATVIQVEKDRVFVDLGTKAEAIIQLEELTDQQLEHASEMFKAGDTFDVIVLRAGGAEGAPLVSKRRADFDNQWQKILDAFEEGTVFQAQVVDRVKGGLVVDIGVRGFVPATHVGSGRLRNIEKYVGQILPVKIIEVDRDRKKVVLSNRSAETERRDEVKDKIFTDVKPQDVLPGVVRRLTEYGAFIDLGGIDGLLHISEMSWMRIDHPKEVLREGDEINVMVLRLDKDSGRISLGLRQVLPDPWNLIRDNYKKGQKIPVKISRLVQSGAFVRLPEGAEAFLPVSEMSSRRIKKPQEAVEAGQEVEATILDLRPDERRMVLSLRDGSEPPLRDAPSYEFGGGRGDRGDRGKSGPGGKKRRKGGRPEPEETSAGRAAPTGGATIGERLGMLKGILPQDAPTEAGAAAPKKPKAPKAEAPAKAEVAAPEPAKAEATAPEPAKAEATAPEPAKAEPVDQEPANAEATPEPVAEANPEATEEKTE